MENKEKDDIQLPSLQRTSIQMGRRSAEIAFKLNQNKAERVALEKQLEELNAKMTIINKMMLDERNKNMNSSPRGWLDHLLKESNKALLVLTEKPISPKRML